MRLAGYGSQMSSRAQVSGAGDVRRAGIADLADATRLFVAYLRFYGKDTPEDAAREFIAERLRRQDSVILLARDGDAACGFMQLYPTFASLSLAPGWILNDLYVDVQTRGRGLGEKLMAAARALAQANGAAEILLQTARDNLPAQRLYERLGYRRDDEFLVFTLDPRATSRS